MPNTKRKFDTPVAPPIDWLWAAVLERQKVYGYDLYQMADIAGMSYGGMRRYINISPWKWKQEARERVCKAFGIRVNYYPTQDNRIEVTL